MAKGRMLNRSVSLSIKFHTLPDDTCRLLATWLIAYLDVNGVFYADPAIVKSLVFPRRTDLQPQQIEYHLNCMAEVGLIQLFDARGQRWMVWPGFTENQVGLRTERESTNFPMPDVCRQLAGNLPETFRQPSGNAREFARKKPAEHEHEHEDEVEVEHIISTYPQATTTQLDKFHHLAAAYPNTFRAALTWAAARGMTAGEALTALTTALPTWKSRETTRPGSTWYTEQEYEMFFMHPERRDQPSG